MCGIAGLIWKDFQRPASIEKIRLMTEIMAHRGPDGQGFFNRGPLALGHRRLSIIDLSEQAGQPMFDSSGRFVAVYNGEIYNYLELRRELIEAGAVFFSDSDTEVLLESYKRWGPDAVTRFNGMWALALYDLERETVFFSRDRLGIKPLYYLDRPDVLAFGSEMKAILAAFPEERRADEAMIHDFLAHGAHDGGPETFFAGVRQLPAAHYAFYDLRTGRFRQERYWDLDLESFRSRISNDDPASALRELLESAVSLHMRSDAPVGTCLSGGLDSSAIVAQMSRLRPDPVYTFSGLYSDPDCDESQFVRLVNNHTGSKSRPIHPDPQGDLTDDLTRIAWHQDAPASGPGLYTQYHVMNQARKDVKVILDGQGGDELFAGYLPYLAPHLRDLLRDGGRGTAEALRLILAGLRHWGREWRKTYLNRRVLSTAMERYGPPGLKNFLEKFLEPAPPFCRPELAERVRGKEIVRSRPRRLPRRLDDALYWDLVQDSIPTLLRYEDRNSMAFSIEARVPLLDYRIVEFALALDGRYKISRTWTKWVFRQAAAGLLPPEVTWRRSKMGYPTPFSRWIRRKSERDQVREILLSPGSLKDGFVPEKTVRHYWDRHQAGEDYGWKIYRLLSLELWRRAFLEAWRPAPALPPPRTETAMIKRP